MSLIFWSKRPIFHSQQVKGELNEDIRKNIYIYLHESFHKVLQASEIMEVTVFDFKNEKNKVITVLQSYYDKTDFVSLGKGRKLHGNIPNVYNANSRFNELKSLHSAQQKAELVGKDQT